MIRLNKLGRELHLCKYQNIISSEKLCANIMLTWAIKTITFKEHLTMKYGSIKIKQKKMSQQTLNVCKHRGVNISKRKEYMHIVWKRTRINWQHQFLIHHGSIIEFRMTHYYFLDMLILIPNDACCVHRMTFTNNVNKIYGHGSMRSQPIIDLWAFEY